MVNMPEKKPVVGLTWQPPLPVSSSLKATDGSHIKTQIGASRSTVWKPTSELVDGLFAPPNDPRKLNKLLRKQVKDTAGKNWFNMPAQTITLELQKDLKLLKLRGAIDPKRHYKKGDSKSKTLPKYFQMGTVVDSPLDFFSGRLTKKERRASLADELLADQNLVAYRMMLLRGGLILAPQHMFARIVSGSRLSFQWKMDLSSTWEIITLILLKAKEAWC